MFAFASPSLRIGPPSSPTTKKSGPNWPTRAPPPSTSPCSSLKPCMHAGCSCFARSRAISGSAAIPSLKTAANLSPKLSPSTPGIRVTTSPTSPNYERLKAGSFSLAAHRGGRGASKQMPPPAHVSATAPPEAAEVLARSIEDFLAEHPHAAILEDGRLLFDLRLAHCSITADHGRCLLHLWSDERTTVRTISGIQPRRDTLRLETHRFGQSKPHTLTLVPDPDFRTPTARHTARRRYLRTPEQPPAPHFAGWSPEGFRSAMDLEHSFGPAYARGILTKAQSAWAIIGVGPEEPPTVIDGALTLGILWLDYCRAHAGGRRLFHGLRVIVPTGLAATTRARMAWLNPA